MFLLITVDLVRGHLDNIPVEYSLAGQRIDRKYLCSDNDSSESSFSDERPLGQ